MFLLAQSQKTAWVCRLFQTSCFWKKISKYLHNANSYELLEKYLVKNTYSEHLQLIPKKLDFREICQNLGVPF